MTRLVLLTALLALAAPATANAAITVPQALQIAYNAVPAGPCAGHTIPHSKRMVDTDGSVDEAVLGPGLGMRVVSENGTERMVLLSCDIALSPDLDEDTYHRCDVILHEYLHTAGWTHVGPHPADRWPACHPRLTRRQRIRELVIGTLPKRYAWRVRCNPRPSRCNATAANAMTRRYVVSRDEQVSEV